MSSIPASLYTSVTPSVLTAGGNGLDLNGLVLTTNARVPIGQVMSFPSSDAVGEYFGSTSREATIAGGAAGMGTGYFGGFRTSTIKPGAILFAQYPLAEVPAYLRGGNISGLTITQLQAISGSLNVTIDGVEKSAMINLSGATSFSNATFLIADALEISGAQAATFTGSITGTTLTVASALQGTLGVGQVLSGEDVAAGTYITRQLTGPIGGLGTYEVSDTQTVESTAIISKAPAVSFDSISGAYTVSSPTTGASSTITFGSGTAAAALGLTEATGAVLSQGADAAEPASFMDQITRQTQNWVSFFTAFDPDQGEGNAKKLAFAAWNNTKNNRYVYIAWDSDIVPTQSDPAQTSLGFLIEQAKISGTCPTWEGTDLNHAAFIAGSIASINFNQPNGRIAFAYKSQDGLVASVTDEIAAVNLGGNPQQQGSFGNGYNYYGAIATANQSFLNFQRGLISGPFRWLDSYVNQIWLNNAFQLAAMTYMSLVNSFPYNPAGYASFEAAMSGVIQSALSFGMFSPNVTLSAEQIIKVNTDAAASIAATLQSQGWYLQVGDASPDVRASRGSPPITFWYVDGGSVQAINIASIAAQ